MDINHTQATVLTAPSQQSEFVGRHNYDSSTGGVNVSSAAYQQIVAATTRAYSGLEIFDSSGREMIFAIGAPGSEVDDFHIIPGGNGKVTDIIPLGSRISVKAQTVTADAGEIIINGLY